MNVLDLFSGIGGFSVGLERAGMRTVAFCEKDAYCRAVLRKHWPAVPCWEDIRHIDANGLGELGRIDLICGGFPCQPYSVAGKQKGKDDDRDLWPEMRRVIALSRPAWVLAENVTGLITVALDSVLADLECLGYASRAVVIPAAGIGAPHRRDRLWIIAADPDSDGRWRLQPQRRADRRDAIVTGAGAQRDAISLADTNSDALWDDQQREARRRDHIQDCRHAELGDDGKARTDTDAHSGRCSSERQPEPCGFEGSSGGLADGLRSAREFDDASASGLADPGVSGLSIPEPEKLQRARRRKEGRAIAECSWWSTEPDVGRVAYGIPNRVDRLRALGNAVVPQVVEVIGRAIMSASGR